MLRTWQLRRVVRCHSQLPFNISASISFCCLVLLAERGPGGGGGGGGGDGNSENIVEADADEDENHVDHASALIAVARTKSPLDASPNFLSYAEAVLATTATAATFAAGAPPFSSYYCC